MSLPSNGTLGPLSQIDPTNASVTYSPGLNFYGSDSFTFRVSDGDQYSNTANVSITVSPTNDQPVATPATVSTIKYATKNITLAGSDPEGVSLTFAIVTQPQYGTVGSVSVTSTTTATVAYTPTDSYSGSDSFTFKVNDGLSDSDPATVSIYVQSATDPVITPADDASASEGDSLSLQLASFSDIDLADTHTASIEWGDGTSSVGIVSESSGSGTVSGSHTYADSGIFTVTVTVEDSGGGASSDTLTLTVSNIAPTVYAGSDSVVGGTAHYTLSPATFTDPGSADTHTATVDWGDGAITVAFVNEESRTVSSSHRYQDKGTFTVTVTVTDDDGASGSDSSQITVTSVPVTVAIPSVTGWGMLLLGSILTILIMFRLRKSGRPQTRH